MNMKVLKAVSWSDGVIEIRREDFGGYVIGCSMKDKGIFDSTNF